MKFQKIFVTVGTTKFDDLIETVASQETTETLQKIGCENLIVQYGHGNDVHFSAAHTHNIHVEKYRLKPNIIDNIRDADLIISHAGAGTCMEVLGEKKLMIAVINENLMDNHQCELAEQLFLDGHIFYCTPKNLNDTLLNSDFSKLKPYKTGNGMKEFVKCLDKLIGF